MTRTFPRNVGKFDRALRTALGITLLLFALFCPFAARQGALTVWASGLVGAVLLVTGLSGGCLLYAALGLSTRRD
ncbi:MAG TPA: DUF2892 domain-containing protein [Paracoccaceae bacterium]|nr:DUF2892 domain-containing protein [Paracoccaceae bacterium]